MCLQNVSRGTASTETVGEGASPPIHTDQKLAPFLPKHIKVCNDKEGTELPLFVMFRGREVGRRDKVRA